MAALFSFTISIKHLQIDFELLSTVMVELLSEAARDMKEGLGNKGKINWIARCCKDNPLEPEPMHTLPKHEMIAAMADLEIVGCRVGRAVAAVA